MGRPAIMRVELPNGEIIEDVPDGTSKLEIAQKAISAGLATKQDFGGFVPDPWVRNQEPDTDINRVAGTTESVLSGASFGHSDEAQAAIAALASIGGIPDSDINGETSTFM